MIHYMRVFGRTLRKGEARAMAVILAVVTLLALNTNIRPKDDSQPLTANKVFSRSLPSSDQGVR